MAYEVQKEQATHSQRLQSHSTVDVETGSMELEHITLIVRGITCGGCETTLRSAIQKLPTVREIRISAILSRVEFDIDTAVINTDSVLETLHKETTYVFQKVIKSQGVWFDALPKVNAKEFVAQSWPLGVVDMIETQDGLVRIYYDAERIGSRDLFEKAFRGALELAPFQVDPHVSTFRKAVIYDGVRLVCSALLTLPVLIFTWAPLPEHPLVYNQVCLALATLVQLAIASEFYLLAWKTLSKSRIIGMDFLAALSTTVAYLYSVVLFALNQNESFFETSTLLTTLILLGRFLSSVTTRRAAVSVSLQLTQPQKAFVYVEDGSKTKEIDCRLLQYGDVFYVAPGSPIVTDGVVVAGMSEVNQSMISGEVNLIPKRPGDTVVAGSANSSGMLDIRLTRLPGDNSISDVALAIDKAKLEKPKIQDVADHVAAWFAPSIVGLSVAVFGIWTMVGRFRQNLDWTRAVTQAATYAVSTLVVSCPCAIGLATPIVVAVAGNLAAQRGIILKKGQTVEIAHKTTHVVFDKTGTLTKGKMMVCVEKWVGDHDVETRSIVLSLLSDVDHPVSAAIAKQLRTQGVAKFNLDAVLIWPGRGVEGRLANNTIRAGNSRWLGLDKLTSVQALTKDGFTVLCVTIDDNLRAIFGLRDTVRTEAAKVICNLKVRGIAVSILSGDDEGAVQAVARELNVEPIRAVAQCSPTDKQVYIKRLQTSGDTIVMFCGDGTNDAPALAQADVGVHIVDGGSDIARSAADAVMLRADLTSILLLIDVSKASFRRIVFNFTWAIIYNLMAVLLAAGAFVKIRIAPAFAGLSELVSVLPVVLISLQLKYIRLKRP